MLACVCTESDFLGVQCSSYSIDGNFRWYLIFNYFRSCDELTKTKIKSKLLSVHVQ